MLFIGVIGTTGAAGAAADTGATGAAGTTEAAGTAGATGAKLFWAAELAWIKYSNRRYIVLSIVLLQLIVKILRCNDRILRIKVRHPFLHFGNIAPNPCLVFH